MAEIAIISQDFCTLQELRNQDPPNVVIDYKSIAPITLVSYALGNKDNEITGGNITYNYSYGFIRKVGPLDTKVGNLRISQNTPDGSLSYPSAYLDMDTNRIINLGDSDEGGASNPSGTPHHAINQRVGDRRYLRKQNWAPEGERTMSNDLLFDGNYRIKRTSDQGTLTISGGYSSDRAIIELSSASPVVNIIASTALNQILGGPNTPVPGTASGSIILQTPDLVSQTSRTVFNSTSTTTIRANGSLNVESPTSNFSGNIVLNPDKTRRVQNVASRTWADIEPATNNQYDNDAINYKSFKDLQRGVKLGGDDNASAQAFNVYVDTVNGENRFRRIVGGKNIRARLVGNDIYLDNVAPLSITISRRGVAAVTGVQRVISRVYNVTRVDPLQPGQVVNYLNTLVPPGSYDSGTQLRVSFEDYDSGNVGPVSTTVTHNFNVALSYSISRVSGARLTGGITGTTSWVPDASQPNFSCPTRIVYLYESNGSTWVYKSQLGTFAV